MATAPTFDPVAHSFQKAIREFKDKLKDEALYKEILKTTSIDQVYDLTDSIQQEQSKFGHLRHLSKIQPYLVNLGEYASAIDTFVQVKPDILGLIWGPIKLLIQWTSTLKKSLDAVVNITAEIGDVLPEFKEMATLFDHNKHINDVMVLFFQDILDFYLVALKFFSMTRWRYFFESLWPKQKDHIEVVKGHIERHTQLLRAEVRLEHIREEHDARLKALEHYQKTEKAHMQQDYSQIYTAISPTSYDTKLDQIDGRICEGTGRWLLEDERFSKWLSLNDPSIRVLWLQGIPGSGKTFLAGTAIRECQGRSRTVFAILSHVYAAQTSALTVLHSLVFQLASSSEALQATLCQSSREHLKSRLDVAKGLLKELLDCSGTTYVVIDGIDEIDKDERRRLLCQLLDLSKNCDTVRILFCGRAESDIDQILQDSATKLRVDEHNSGSIQAFVTRRSKAWLDDTDRRFLPHERVEIEHDLARIAVTAKGMFLYAKIVLDWLERLEDIPDVMKELAELPETLDLAYDRILARINNLSPITARQKARKLLGFVGCSPVPLTVQELQQLLELVPEDDEYPRRTALSLNPVGLCGPIVEVVDGYVQVVHFTVKEYMFNPKLDKSIPKLEMALELATSCIQYLCQSHHNPDITVEEIERQISRGAYRLHTFAETTWLSLVELCVRLSGSDALSPKLLEVLGNFVEKRSPSEIEEASSLPDQVNKLELQRFRDVAPRIYQFLCREAEFRRRCSASDFQMNNGYLWKHLDALNTSDISILLHNKINDMLCGLNIHVQGCCQYGMLEMLYGPRPFKCGYLACPFRRHGFPTESLQRSHTKHHSKPWKCSVVGCEYAEIGFLSRRMQNDHLDRFHREQPSDVNLPMPYTPKDDLDELKSLIVDLVKLDQVEAVKPLLVQFQASFQASFQGRWEYLELPLIIHQLLELAAVSPSIAMMQVIADSQKVEYASIWLQALSCAAQANNVGLVTQILDSEDVKMSGSQYYPTYQHQVGDIWRIRGWDEILQAVLHSDSQELFQSLENQFLEEFTTKREYGKIVPPWARALSQKVITATANQPGREHRLIRLWDGLLKNTNEANEISKSRRKRYLGNALVEVASSCPSIPMANALIGYGAEVDHRVSSKYRTPLQHALRRSSLQSAEMARFLLYRGASPNTGTEESERQSGRHIVMAVAVAEEAGAREISKWLGMTWEALVHKVEQDRASGICPPEFA